MSKLQDAMRQLQTQLQASEDDSQALQRFVTACLEPSLPPNKVVWACHTMLPKVLSKHATSVSKDPTSAQVLLEVARIYLRFATVIGQNTPRPLLAQILQPLQTLTTIRDPKIALAGRHALAAVRAAGVKGSVPAVGVPPP
eukprot:CAMPEP_0118938698 /NCGR_PEP_ID=MMETSP1169-20130426/26806_1 /TAXON_ID=36882 /ORGANISM="Pyramimonas obovata, Strain CCMP722" /LENGTH=140 /DNA_ID=CAMNT_0006882723 /DNA_START=184 /DNA_END=602 /DNA_ORIENTATION=+